MIHFACLQCGTKFKVKDEFAGKSSKCPTCKNPVQVPTASQTMAYVPADSIDGSESSLDKAGVNPSVTLASQAGKEAASVEALAQKKLGRYVIDKEIARGGMGAVLRGIDRDIRREVAIKFMLHDTDAKQKARFVEEAQITGQLEHPNIVPVHELGVDAKKRLFFTMKMVQGRSLAQILEALAKDSSAERQWSLGKLLNIVVNICHALGYAHSRNVIHRDLKPANIMIGDFGEVYVMDWGLAKVLGEKVPARKAPKETFSAKPLPPTGMSGISVSTSREAEGDLTQDGAIMGTPAYMPPEQALGNVHDIDQRSDIYSLGAILYAVLTLQSPIEKGGDPIALLMRVIDGTIKKPEERTPTRKIPPELSAVAMKALAKEPKDRYQTVEAFRRDLELFLEGRSVSAKQDTAREQVWKLIKRNKGASIATAAALLVLTSVVTIAFFINNAARVEAVEERGKAVKAYADFEKAQKEKEETVRQSLPALIRAGRQLANDNAIDKADAQVKLAQFYDAKNADALLLKGQILVARKEWPAARESLDAYLRQRPDDAENKLLLASLNGAVDDGPTLFAVIESLQRQQLPGLAAPLLPDLQKIIAAKEPLLSLYRKQIEAHWKKQGSRLVITSDGELQFKVEGAASASVVDLAPLRDIPLNILSVNNSAVSDLTLLKTMPLHELQLLYCPVEDIGPLRGLPLRRLDVGACKFKSLEPLRGMKTLRHLNLGETSVQDLSPLHGLPLTSLNARGCRLLRDLLPLERMPLEMLHLYANGLLDDLTPLHGMLLKHLDVVSCPRITDISPLKGMPLTTLSLNGTRVRDLEPLRGMKIDWLDVGNTPVEDLRPVRSLPLKVLGVASATIKDVSPLAGMNLERIVWSPKYATEGVAALREMETLRVIEVNQKSYEPADFWHRYDAGEFKK